MPDFSDVRNKEEVSGRAVRDRNRGNEMSMLITPRHAYVNIERMRSRISNLFDTAYFYNVPWPDIPAFTSDECNIYGMRYRMADVFHRFGLTVADSFLDSVRVGAVPYSSIIDIAVNAVHKQTYMFAQPLISKVLYSLEVSFESPSVPGSFIISLDQYVGRNVNTDVTDIKWFVMLLPIPERIQTYKHLCTNCPERLLCMMKQRTESGKCLVADKFFQKVDKS